MIDSTLHQATSVGTKRNFTGEISKMRRNQQVLTILVLLLVAVIFWIIVTVFASQRSTSISPEVIKMAEPLNPAIDDAIFTDLEGRRTFTDEELADFPIMVQVSGDNGEKKVVPLGTAVASPTPRPTATPVATARPSLLSEPDATPEP